MATSEITKQRVVPKSKRADKKKLELTRHDLLLFQNCKVLSSSGTLYLTWAEFITSLSNSECRRRSLDRI